MFKKHRNALSDASTRRRLHKQPTARRIAGVTTVLVGSLALFSASFSNASVAPKATSKSTSPVKPDKKFFSGKTITMLSVSGAGSPFYTIILYLEPYIEQYLHTTMNIEIGSTTASAQDQLYSSAPNGLTIGGFTPPPDVYDQAANFPGGVSFPIKTVIPIGGYEAAPLTYVACKGSDIKTFKQLLSGAGQFDYLSTAGGEGEARGQELFGPYKLQAHMLTGYASSTAQYEGCLRGDGTNSVTAEAANDFTPAEMQSVVTPLITLGKPYPNSAFSSVLANVPLLSQVIKTDPPKGRGAVGTLNYLVASQRPQLAGNSWIAPPKTPAARVLALTDAFKYAYSQPTVKQELLAFGTPPVFVSPQTVESGVQSMLKLVKDAGDYFTYGD